MKSGFFSKEKIPTLDVFLCLSFFLSSEIHISMMQDPLREIVTNLIVEASYRYKRSINYFRQLNF